MKLTTTNGKGKSSGFTLIELLVAIVFLGVLFSVIFGVTGGLRKADSAKLDSLAREYVEGLYGDEATFVGLSFADTDTDGNSYVSGTVSYKLRGEDKPQTVELECAGATWSIMGNSGCRPIRNQFGGYR
jgi:prepilin-type N-terminal cleavage/methylation domain-containing protein